MGTLLASRLSRVVCKLIDFRDELIDLLRASHVCVHHSQVLFG